jgi:hypothetical protein
MVCNPIGPGRDTKLQKKSPAKHFDRGHFYFSTEGQPYFGARGQSHLARGVNSPRIFQSDHSYAAKIYIKHRKSK